MDKGKRSDGLRWDMPGARVAQLVTHLTFDCCWLKLLSSLGQGVVAEFSIQRLNIDTKVVLRDRADIIGPCTS